MVMQIQLSYTDSSAKVKYRLIKKIIQILLAEETSGQEPVF